MSSSSWSWTLVVRVFCSFVVGLVVDVMVVGVVGRIGRLSLLVTSRLPWSPISGQLVSW